MSSAHDLDVLAEATYYALHSLSLYLSTSRGKFQCFQGFCLMPLFQGECADDRDVCIPAQRVLE